MYKTPYITVKISTPIKKYVKDMVTGGFRPSEQSMMMVSEQVSDMIQERIPVKQPDPVGLVWIATSTMRGSRDLSVI